MSVPGDAAARSTERAIAVIELVAGNGGLTLTELACQLALPKSSVHGLVHTLRRRGYVSFDEARRTYHLGMRLWELGQAFHLHEELVRLALPLMREIGGELNEITQLAARDGIHNVYLAKVDCDQPIQLISRVGARLYCHATGLGKALLSGLADDELVRLYDGVSLPRFTEHTITDLPALRIEVDQIRAQGYAEDREEYVAGLRCVAVPLRSHDGRVLAAMSLSLPAPRATAEKLAHGRRLLLEGGKQFQERLTTAVGFGLDAGAAMLLQRQEGGGSVERSRRTVEAGR